MWADLKDLLVRCSITLLFVFTLDVVLYLYEVSQQRPAGLHPAGTVLASLVLAMLLFAFAQEARRHERFGWGLRGAVPSWGVFQPYFRSARYVIHVVVLAYGLFYISESLASGSDLGRWI